MWARALLGALVFVEFAFCGVRVAKLRCPVVPPYERAICYYAENILAQDMPEDPNVGLLSDKFLFHYPVDIKNSGPLHNISLLPLYQGAVIKYVLAANASNEYGVRRFWRLVGYSDLNHEFGDCSGCFAIIYKNRRTFYSSTGSCFIITDIFVNGRWNYSCHNVFKYLSPLAFHEGVGGPFARLEKLRGCTPQSGSEEGHENCRYSVYCIMVIVDKPKILVQGNTQVSRDGARHRTRGGADVVAGILILVSLFAGFVFIKIVEGGKL